MPSALVHSILLIGLHSLLAVFMSGPVSLLTLLYLCIALQYSVVIQNYSEKNLAQGVFILLIASLVAKAVYLTAPVLLTGDLPRYLWEGMLTREGINPYKFAPDAAELVSLRTSYWEQIQYKHLTAIYPPFAQSLLGIFATTELSWRITLWFFELITATLLTLWLTQKKLPHGRALVYCALPLSFLETTLSGHLEAVMVPMLIFLFIQFEAKEPNPFVVGVTGAAATLVKYPLVLPLVLCGFLNRTKTMLFSGIFFVLFSAVLCARYFDPELSIFNSLSTYLTHWRFNYSFFFAVGQILNVNWNDSQSIMPVKVISLATWLGLMAYLFSKTKDLVTLTLYGFLIFLLTGPVFHPWYALWFAPLLVVHNSASALWLLITLPLSYAEVLAVYPSWLKLLIFLPAWALLLYELKTTED